MSTFTENLDSLLCGEGPQGEILQTAPTVPEFMSQYAAVFYYACLWLGGQLGNYMAPDQEPYKTWIEGHPWEDFDGMMAAGIVALFP